MYLSDMASDGYDEVVAQHASPIMCSVCSAVFSYSSEIQKPGYSDEDIIRLYGWPNWLIRGELIKKIAAILRLHGETEKFSLYKDEILRYAFLKKSLVNIDYLEEKMREELSAYDRSCNEIKEYRERSGQAYDNVHDEENRRVIKLNFEQSASFLHVIPMGILNKMAFRRRIKLLVANANANGDEVEKMFYKDLYCFVSGMEIGNVENRLRPKKEAITQIPAVYEKALVGAIGRERIQLLKHYVWAVERLKMEEKLKYADKYDVAMRALADTLPANGSGGECLLKAEMLRRLGKYQEAIDILDKFDFSDDAEWKIMSMAIKEHAKESDSDLFILTVDERMEIAKQLGCYDKLSSMLGIEDKFRITS